MPDETLVRVARNREARSTTSSLTNYFVLLSCKIKKEIRLYNSGVTNFTISCQPPDLQNADRIVLVSMLFYLWTR